MCMPPPRTPQTMCESKQPDKSRDRCNPSPNCRAPWPKPRACPLKSPGGPAHAECASGGTYVGSTTSRKCRSSSRHIKTRMVKAEAIDDLLTVYMQCVDPSPGTLLQTPHRIPPGVVSHHRGTAQENRPLDGFVQPCPRGNPVWEHWDNIAHEKTFAGRGAYPKEWRAVAKANRVWKPWERSAERTGRGKERVDRPIVYRAKSGRLA